MCKLLPNKYKKIIIKGFHELFNYTTSIRAIPTVDKTNIGALVQIRKLLTG